LAEAEFGRIWEKWPNFGFAEAEAEIRCNPNKNKQQLGSTLQNKKTTKDFTTVYFYGPQFGEVPDTRPVSDSPTVFSLARRQISLAFLAEREKRV